MTTQGSIATREEGELEKGAPEEQCPAHDEPGSELAPQQEGDAQDPSQEQNQVWWDEPADQDPANPMNWPAWRKWSNIAILSFITFLT
jgi:hypothetical protein